MKAHHKTFKHKLRLTIVIFCGTVICIVASLDNPAACVGMGLHMAANFFWIWE